MIIQHVKRTYLSYLKVFTVLTVSLSVTACRSASVVRFVPVSANKATHNIEYLDPSRCVLEEFTGDPEITTCLKDRILLSIARRSESSSPVERTESDVTLACEVQSSGNPRLTQRVPRSAPMQVLFHLRSSPSGAIRLMRQYQLPLTDAARDSLEIQLQQIADRFMDAAFPFPADPIEVELAIGNGRFDKQGHQAAKNGQYQDAMNYFLQAVDANPTNHAALYNAGVMFESLGAPLKAKIFYERALKLDNSLLYEQALARK
jgi:hypothetical protein